MWNHGMWTYIGTCLGSCETSLLEILWKNCKRLKAVNYFCKTFHRRLISFQFICLWRTKQYVASWPTKYTVGHGYIWMRLFHLWHQMRGTDIDLWCWLKSTLNKNDEKKQYLPKWHMPYVIWHMYICMYEHTANKYWQNIRKKMLKIRTKTKNSYDWKIIC